MHTKLLRGAKIKSLFPQGFNSGDNIWITDAGGPSKLKLDSLGTLEKNYFPNKKLNIISGLEL